MGARPGGADAVRGRGTRDSRRSLPCAVRARFPPWPRGCAPTSLGRGSGGDPDPGVSLRLSWRGRAVGRSGGERGLAARGGERGRAVGAGQAPGAGVTRAAAPGHPARDHLPSLGDPAPSPGPPPPGSSAAPGVPSRSVAGPRGAAAGARPVPLVRLARLHTSQGARAAGGLVAEGPDV
ncbi:translation initiation factor IF-2-like [Meles meles]|uniref:translation initiation factor IF-2-like n=1 Tax=Meles meles TaxID=9662 RepID=UPI001E69C6A3|nr:translation initiation factor IF-2-like [Meles meles]